MQTKVQEIQQQEPVETPGQPGPKVEPKKQVVSFQLNRAQRRAKGKADRMTARKALRHAMKHDPKVFRREMRKKLRLCPTCGLNFLSGLWRCQCKVQRPRPVGCS